LSENEHSVSPARASRTRRAIRLMWRGLVASVLVTRMVTICSKLVGGPASSPGDRRVRHEEWLAPVPANWPEEPDFLLRCDGTGITLVNVFGPPEGIADPLMPEPTGPPGAMPRPWQHLELVGLPFRGLMSVTHGGAQTAVATSWRAGIRAPIIGSLPIVPVCPGFALNWALAVLCLSAAPLFRELRHRSRIRRGRCGECGYKLGATQEVCPECGVVAVAPRPGTRTVQRV
jgi:hypothetical protein